MDYGDKPAAAKRSLLTPPRWSLFAPPLTEARPIGVSDVELACFPGPVRWLATAAPRQLKHRPHETRKPYLDLFVERQDPGINKNALRRQLLEGNAHSGHGEVRLKPAGGLESLQALVLSKMMDGLGIFKDGSGPGDFRFGGTDDRRFGGHGDGAEEEGTERYSSECDGDKHWISDRATVPYRHLIPYPGNERRELSSQPKPKTAEIPKNTCLTAGAMVDPVGPQEPPTLLRSA